MGAQPQLLPILNAKVSKSGSKELIQSGASNEFIFAVVGHAGSGTSVVAQSLEILLKDTSIGADKFEVSILKASQVILDWAKLKGKTKHQQAAKRTLSYVQILQDYGDEMRSEPVQGGLPDHSAVARGLIELIQQARAKATQVAFVRGQEVQPDGKPRAYILDSIRHPDEVTLLRNLYAEAFVLIGVVCEEDKRIKRIFGKYTDGGRDAALEFMKRDADADKKYGQHVADAFHLADMFVDNTADRLLQNQSANKDWNVNEDLSRLVKIVTHSEMVRPKVSETAMFHAFSAQMQSACLSRQVGAAVVDWNGNLVATGSNEAPKAGGGVYGEGFKDEAEDGRCAYFENGDDRYCRNTREQNKIVEELVGEVAALQDLKPEQTEQLRQALRKTRIGGLLEFSRAVHAEMDAILSAARTGASLVGCRLFVTTFPCHYCARHIVTAGIDEVQFIEPYPKSQALLLHRDSIDIEFTGWIPPSKGGKQVLFRPFSGVAPRLYERAFLKIRELKDKTSGNMKIQPPTWTTPWHLPKNSYVSIEAKLTREVKSDESAT